MTAEPLLAALAAPGPSVSAGRGREPASDAGAAFLAILAGLIAGAAPPRSNAPAPGSGIGAAPGMVDEGASATAAPGVTVPADAAPEGTPVDLTAVRDGGIAPAATRRGDALTVNPATRGPALGERGAAGVAPAAGRQTSAQPTAAPSDTMAATRSLPLLSASGLAESAPADRARIGRAAAEPSLPPPDVLTELRDASGSRMDRAAVSEASSSSRPAAPAPTPGAQVGVEITRAVANRIDHMVVHLEPPELGRVRIDLSFGNEGQLSARIAVDRAETLEILQRDAHTLERSLQEAGLRADNGGLSFSLRREPGQGDQNGSRMVQAPVDDQDEAAAEQCAGGGRALPGLRLLDIRA